jgi:hypothetical protein
LYFDKSLFLKGGGNKDTVLFLRFRFLNRSWRGVGESEIFSVLRLDYGGPDDSILAGHYFRYLAYWPRSPCTFLVGYQHQISYHESARLFGKFFPLSQSWQIFKEPTSPEMLDDLLCLPPALAGQTFIWTDDSVWKFGQGRQPYLDSQNIVHIHFKTTGGLKT